MGIAIVSIAGINSAFENIHGVDIFDGIILPPDIDKETLIDRIMFRCMEFSIMHTDPEFFHFQVLNFFKIHYRTFDKWMKALNIKYEPLENYDRIEDYSGSGDRSGSNSSTSSNSESGTGTDTRTKSAFNSSGYEPYEREQTSNSSNGTGSISGTEMNEYSDIHSLRAHGNIGVTTSQQMLESEWEVAKLNVYTAIADLFCDEFCIMVY